MDRDEYEDMLEDFKVDQKMDEDYDFFLSKVQDDIELLQEVVARLKVAHTLHHWEWDITEHI